MITISTIVTTAACFFAAVLNLASEHRFRTRIMSALFATALLLGLLVYGYGYSCTADSPLVAILRTIMAVCRMFAGSNELNDIEAAPLFARYWAVTLFWLAHFLAFYVTASAAATTIGSKVLRRVRILLLRRGTLLIIYGVNANSIAYGKRQSDALRRSVVYIGQADPDAAAKINAAGGMLEKSGEQPDALLLRKLGICPGRRRIEVAALHEDGLKNFRFAHALMEVFERANIHPGQTALLAQDVDEDRAAGLAASGKKYGYGSVMAFDEYNLAARLMVQKLPPCDTVSFDADARAQQDFNALIIGFGRMGRAALDAIVMNGQFAGSTFRADVFDANAQNGSLHGHEILSQYDVRFHKAGGKSDELYAFLNDRMAAVRYVAVCTGSEKENREIARELGAWMRERGAAPAIAECTVRGLSFLRAGEHESVSLNIYGSDALDLERIDRMAMAINHAYSSDSGKTPQENWAVCDYFSRMSSRASADFYPAILRAARRTAQQAESGDWPPCPDVLENLAITEHLRWCAFHYVMGFHPMSEAEYAQRAERYLAEVRERGASSLRIGKDLLGRKHACLIPWESLDALSARENAVTGGHVDYKQMDRNNILALPDILAVLREMPF